MYASFINFKAIYKKYIIYFENMYTILKMYISKICICIVEGKVLIIYSEIFITFTFSWL